MADSSGAAIAAWNGTQLGYLTMAHATLSVQTAAATIASVASVPSGSVGAGTYHVTAWANVTAATTNTLSMEVTYTDENNVAQTKVLNRDDGTGGLLSATGDYNFIPIDIRAKYNTAITLKTILPTSTGSIAYDAGGALQQAY